MWKKTYICKGAQRAQKADNYQAQDKKFTPVREMIRVFIQHGGDDGLQPTKLEHRQSLEYTLSLHIIC